MPINFLELVDGMPFPATKTEIIDFAQDQGASEEALDILQALPGERYEHLSDLNAQIGLVEQLPGGKANLFSSSQSA